jgi:hypothetical protein
MLGIKPKEVAVPLIFGICVHEGVELFYQLRSEIDGTPSQEQIVQISIKCIQKFTEKWVDFGITGDNIRNLDSGIKIMHNYVRAYANDGTNFNLCDIESAQWVAMPNGTMMLVKMDRVLNQGHLINLVDTKTTSMHISGWYWRMFENHLPTTLYSYVVRELLGRCDLVTIDAIKVPPPESGSTSEPFGRQQFIRTPLQIQDAVNTYCAKTDYICNVLGKPEDEWATRMYCNQGECDKYSGCEYLAICKHGLDHPMVKIDFDIKPPDREKGKTE